MYKEFLEVLKMPKEPPKVVNYISTLILHVYTLIIKFTDIMDKPTVLYRGSKSLFIYVIHVCCPLINTIENRLAPRSQHFHFIIGIFHLMIYKTNILCLHTDVYTFV